MTEEESKELMTGEFTVLDVKHQRTKKKGGIVDSNVIVLTDGEATVKIEDPDNRFKDCDIDDVLSLEVILQPDSQTKLPGAD